MSARVRCCGALLRAIGVIGTAHQGPCFYVRETHFATGLLIFVEFFLRNIPQDGKVLLRWPEILSQCKYLDMMVS